MFRIKADASKRLSRISPEIYGHFSEHLGRCIYGGIYVGEDSTIPNVNGMRTDVVEALKNIRIPVLRWPGGCFADEYHWQDGIGKKSERKHIVNTNWGGVTEDNSFGTHEFMELCSQLGCEPYINGNVGSGTVREMAEWVEYLTSGASSPMTELRRENGREEPWRVKFFGVGNESWGCGGSMRPEFYADEYRRYRTFCRNYSGNELFPIACGPSGDDYDWTDKLLSIVKPCHTKAISLHYYTIASGDWSNKGTATQFSSEEYYGTLKRTYYMRELLKRHLAVMDRHDPNHEIGLIVDEWGMWYDVEPGTNPGFLYQQNTMRDALVAAINLDIFNANSDRVIMANIAQVVNVLQAVILTEGDKMVKTPTYHVFDLYKEHQGATLLSSTCDGAISDGLPLLSHTVSTDGDCVLLTVSNASLTDEAEIEFSTDGFDIGGCDARLLTNEVHAHNTFDSPEAVAVKAADNFTISGGKAVIKLPPCSVEALRFTKKA